MIHKEWIIKPFKQEHADKIISYGMNSKLMEIDASFKENRICLADKGNAYTLFLNKRGIDPAIATGPFITTSNDIFGILIYFMIAKIILQF